MKKQNNATPQDIWNLLHAIQEDRRKARAEAEAERKKSEEKFKKQLEEFVNSTDTKINRVEGRWANQWGDLTEALTNKSVVDLFKKWGMKVGRTTINYPGRYNGDRREFDILVIDGKEIAVLEVKSTLNQKKIDRFLNTMENFKKYCPEYKNFIIYAGLAYIKGNEHLLKYAERKGLFLISVGGKTAMLINKKQFKPKHF